MKTKSHGYVVWGNVIPLFFMLVFIVGICCVSCTESSQVKQDIDIDQMAINRFNGLTPPIILLAKDKTMGYWGVVLIDSTKKIVTIGDLTSLGNRLGNSYEIGDTIVK